MSKKRAMRKLCDEERRDIARFTNAIEGCLGGILLGLIVFLMLIMLSGCATCPPCQPKVETVEVKVPVLSCPSPPQPPQLILPEFSPPPDQESAETLKEWYVEMVRVWKIRYELLLARIALLEEILDQYRSPNPQPSPTN